MTSGDYRVLVVDDEPSVRTVVARALHRMGQMSCVEADSIASVRQNMEEEGPFALIMLDIALPDGSGLDLLPELAPLAPETVVVMVTGNTDWAPAVQSLKNGAYDYLAKPLDLELVQLAAARALKRRQTEMAEQTAHQERREELARQISSLQKARSALLRAMCRMAEFRDAEQHAHLERIPLYSHVIAMQLSSRSAYAAFVTEQFLWNVFEAAPLHDIGKVALPDGILLKPSPLNEAETAIMHTHASVGRDICLTASRDDEDGENSLIEMAADIAGYHHERWDGAGYPEGLKGTHIPLSARIVGLADFYDVCRTATVYRPEPLPREKVFGLIKTLRGEKFDPVLVDAFLQCEDSIIEIEDSDRS